MWCLCSGSYVDCLRIQDPTDCNAGNVELTPAIDDSYGIICCQQRVSLLCADIMFELWKLSGLCHLFKTITQLEIFYRLLW